jgi:hypothetical protein
VACLFYLYTSSGLSSKKGLSLSAPHFLSSKHLSGWTAQHTANRLIPIFIIWNERRFCGGHPRKYCRLEYTLLNVNQKMGRAHKKIRKRNSSSKRCQLLLAARPTDEKCMNVSWNCNWERWMELSVFFEREMNSDSKSNPPFTSNRPSSAHSVIKILFLYKYICHSSKVTSKS